MVDTVPIPAPGFEGRGLVLVPAGLWKGAYIVCDGADAPRQGRVFTLNDNGGTPVTLRLVGNGFEALPRIETGGQVIKLGPPLPWWGGLLIVAPFVLIVIGGLLGGICGALAAAANTQVMRSQLPDGLKIVLSLVSIVIATVIWLMVGLALYAVSHGG